MNLDYLKDLAARVGGAFIAALLSSLAVGAGDTTAFSITAVDWPTALSVAGGAAVLSLLKGLAAKLRTPQASTASLRDSGGPPRDARGRFTEQA